MIQNKLTKKTFDEICTGQYEFVIPYLYGANFEAVF